MADAGQSALSGAEEQQIAQQQQIRQAEEQTGQVPIARTATHEPEEVDPRFDRDDLRQGKPPPAVKKHRLRLRRHRKAKGKPLTAEERKQIRAGTAPDDAADMTDDEVDMTDDEGGNEDKDDDGKKPGLISKLLGKDKD